MKIVTRSKLKDSGYSLAEGEEITVPDDLGRLWCDAGWCEDVTGVYPATDFVTGKVTVQVDSMRHKRKGVYNHG